MDITTVKRNPPLLITLAAAILQGVLLYWLHTAIENKEWPATRLPWLATFYAVSLFVPLTIQLLSAHWRQRLLWWAAGILGVAYAYFGWHFGSQVGISLQNSRLVDEDATFVFVLSLGLLWLLFMPFLRARLTFGRWRCEYAELFSVAWQNVIQLGQAGIFTGVFWALLGVWAMLFKMLGYNFFKEMFTEPAFVYPFTAITVGGALYLTGSVERLVTVAREHILGLLKWLAPVAALILALFTPTLLVKLPGLVFHGERAIGAVWLLWLLTMTVMLLNAGYQNGAVEKPYPKPIAFALRCVVPAMVIVALTALYALFVRASEYGITVERVFAILIALTALGYSVGYASAAMRRGGPWLKGIERVNVGVALGVMVVLVLTLTPLASPYRLAASSQSSRVLADRSKSREDALRFLRFDAGRYGMDALLRLSNMTITQPEGLVADAKEMLTVKDRWESVQTVRLARDLSKISVYPAGRSLELPLIEVIRADLRPEGSTQSISVGNATPVALLIDLNDDSIEECVLFTERDTLLYVRRNGLWSAANNNAYSSAFHEPNWKDLISALSEGDYAPEARPWQDLRIAGKIIRWQLPDETPGK
jgi:hypothetical protein